MEFTEDQIAFRDSIRRMVAKHVAPIAAEIDETDRFPTELVKLYGELVQTAFSQRRKILRHTLGKWLEEHGFSGEFDVQRRAEEVPVAQYVALAGQVPKV